MRYHIKNEKGDIIASFVNEYDRECSFDALEEMFSDCGLEKYDDDTK